MVNITQLAGELQKQGSLCVNFAFFIVWIMAHG